MIYGVSSLLMSSSNVIIAEVTWEHTTEREIKIEKYELCVYFNRSPARGLAFYGCLLIVEGVYCLVPDTFPNPWFSCDDVSGHHVRIVSGSPYVNRSVYWANQVRRVRFCTAITLCGLLLPLTWATFSFTACFPHRMPYLYKGVAVIVPCSCLPVTLFLLSAMRFVFSYLIQAQHFRLLLESLGSGFVPILPTPATTTQLISGMHSGFWLLSRRLSFSMTSYTIVNASIVASNSFYCASV